VGFVVLASAPSGSAVRASPFPPLRKPVTWIFSRHGRRKSPTPKHLSGIQAFSETHFVYDAIC